MPSKVQEPFKVITEDLAVEIVHDIASAPRYRQVSLFGRCLPVYEQARAATGCPVMPLTLKRVREFDGAVLASIDDVLVGYAMFADRRERQLISSHGHDHLYDPGFEPHGIYIEQVAVTPDFQNQHVGGKLYEALYDAFPECDVYAHVAVDNPQSLRFHGRNGFIPIGDYISGNYHSLLMRRETL